MNAAVKKLTSPHVCDDCGYVSVDRSTDVRVYAPPPEDKLRCNTFNAHDDFSGENITQDLRLDKEQTRTVGGRRMGKAGHVALAGPDPADYFSTTSTARCTRCGDKHPPTTPDTEHTR